VAGLLRVLASAPLLLGVATGCLSIHLFEGGAEAPLRESVVRGDEGPKILLVDIDGMIDGEDLIDPLFGIESPGMVARVREVLDRAREDPEVRALLLRIDSPGGTVTASDQIYTEISRFRRERGVPVMAQLLSTATSGGYYVAMAAGEIQAHPTTVTGSIGVIFTSVSVAGLMEKLGVEDQTITAGRYKDAGSPLRRLEPEERAQIQAIVDDLHDRFRSVVVRGRPGLTESQVAELADGRIYSASQALERGLVDRIGTLEEAVEALESELGVDRSRVVAYHRPREIRRNLYTRGPVRGPRIEAPVGALWPAPPTAGGLERMLSRPAFLYLWWPALAEP
jgi:protease-4